MPVKRDQCQTILRQREVGLNRDLNRYSDSHAYPKACPTEQVKAMYYATAPDLFAFLRMQKEKAKPLMAQCWQWGTRQRAPLRDLR